LREEAVGQVTRRRAHLRERPPALGGADGRPNPLQGPESSALGTPGRYTQLDVDLTLGG